MHKKILRHSAAVPALATPAALVASEASAMTTAPGPGAERADTKAPSLSLRIGNDLMSFTTGNSAERVLVAQHESHASQASHESHASHASGT